MDVEGDGTGHEGEARRGKRSVDLPRVPSEIKHRRVAARRCSITVASVSSTSPSKTQRIELPLHGAQPLVAVAMGAFAIHIVAPGQAAPLALQRGVA